MKNNALVLWDNKILRPVNVDLSLVQTNANVFVTATSKGIDRHNFNDKKKGFNNPRRPNRETSTHAMVDVDRRVDSLVDTLFKFSTLSTVTVEFYVQGCKDQSNGVILSEAALSLSTSVNLRAVKTVAHLKIYEMDSKTKSISDLHKNCLPFMLPWQLSCKLLTYPLLLMQEDSTQREVRPLTLQDFETHWAQFFQQGYEQHCSITHTSRVDVPPLITPWFGIKSPTGVDSNNNHMAQIIKVLKKKLCLKDPVKSKKTTNKKAVKSKQVLDVPDKSTRGNHTTRTCNVKKKYKSKLRTADDSYPPVCDADEDNEDNEGGDDCIELMEEVVGGEEDDKADCYDLFAVGQDEDEGEDDMDDAEAIELADDEEKDLVVEDNEFEDGDQDQDELEAEEDDEEPEDDDEPLEDDEVDLDDEAELDDEVDLDDEFEDDDDADAHDLGETTNDLTNTFPSNVTYYKPNYMTDKRTTGILETSATVIIAADTTTRAKRKKQKLQ